MREMVARLIGSEVRVEFELAAQPSIVRVDVGQIEQVVINLLLNARDAMPHGGRIHVRTSTADAAPATGGRRMRVRQGRFVTLAVSDTGQGMDAETRQRVFEPFFTTRADGGGTGLGLASVHAIVMQAGGSIDVKSEPGQGSTFTIYWPAAEAAVDEASVAVRDAGPARAATVLVVEDHDVIRRLCRRVLENEGHIVAEASNVEHALQKASEMQDLDLLLADVRLGGENGLELARTLRVGRPSIRVLLMSGYASPRVEDAAFLEKPFTPAALVSAVRQVLGHGGSAGDTR
jgi:CheY-like chemotaxis protein